MYCKEERQTPRPLKRQALMATVLLGLLFSNSSFAISVLVFSKVEGAAGQSSTRSGITAIREIGTAKGWRVDVTTDSKAFNSGDLSQYDVVVWNNTKGNVLTRTEKTAFEDFIHRGGGYAGIHAAVAGITEPGWSWYERLVGARYKRQLAGTSTETIHVAPEFGGPYVSPENPAVRGLPKTWAHADAWYEWIEDPLLKPNTNWYKPYELGMYGLLFLNSTTVAWCHEFEGTRAFYTALGGTEASFSDKIFREHLAGGIEWASAHSPNLRFRSREIEVHSLIVDLNADKGVTLEDGDRVAAWKNQVPGFIARDFVKRDEGRSLAENRQGPGSGRPTLKRSVPALDGHNSLSFREAELVNLDENAFDDLITGSGYTWIVIMAPYAQIGMGEDLNSFMGDLNNSPPWEGFWANLDDDNRVWIGARNGLTFQQYDAANNPRIYGPRLQRNQYYIVAGRMGAGVGAVTIEVFVDSATPTGSGLFSVNPKAKSSRLAIGQERDATNHPGFESFDGEIARVLIYKRPLSNEELADTINALKLTYFRGVP